MTHQAHIEILAPMLVVPDVEQTVAYYCDKLGFSIRLTYPANPGMAIYAVVVRDNYQVHFTKGTLLGEPGTKGGVSLTVDNVDTLYAELKERRAFSANFPVVYDAIREHPPEDKEYGRRDLIMVDCNGYILMFGVNLS